MTKMNSRHAKKPKAPNKNRWDGLFRSRVIGKSHDPRDFDIRRRVVDHEMAEDEAAKRAGWVGISGVESIASQEVLSGASFSFCHKFNLGHHLAFIAIY